MATEVNCPQCGQTHAARVVGEYTNILGVERVSLLCPHCACRWNEDRLDIINEEVDDA